MSIPFTLATSAGPVTVDATEPVPGLRVFKTPASVSPSSPYRWVLAHHDNTALAAFESEAAAVHAAELVAPLADWTRNAITAANEIGTAGMQDLMVRLRNAGGQHPNA
jgi:hypothetical protein